MKLVTLSLPSVAVELVNPLPTDIVYVFGYLIITIPELPAPPLAAPPHPPPPEPVFTTASEALVFPLEPSPPIEEPPEPAGPVEVPPPPPPP